MDDFGIFTSLEQTTFNISNDFTIPLSTSFLPYLHHRMCVCGAENDDGYRVWLKMCVRWLFDRKVHCEVKQFLVVVMCLLLSMVVWQPFGAYWRLIIARVFEMHVAHHKLGTLVVYLHPWNKQHSTSQTASWYLSFLPSLPASSNVCVCVGGEGGIADIECDVC